MTHVDYTLNPQRYTMRATCRTTTGTQAGLSMVEVLVALVVLSVGLLGIASMYVTALQAKTTSGSRMKAVNLAYDIADRMRANPAGAANYVLAQGDATTRTNCISTSTTCTPTQIAASDLYQWVQTLSDSIKGLPGGAYGTISQDAVPTTTAPGTYTITLTWSESTANDLKYKMQVQL